MVVKARLDGAGPVEGVSASHGLGLTQRVPQAGTAPGTLSPARGHTPGTGAQGGKQPKTPNTARGGQGWALHETNLSFLTTWKRSTGISEV